MVCVCVCVTHSWPANGMLDVTRKMLCWLHLPQLETERDRGRHDISATHLLETQAISLGLAAVSEIELLEECLCERAMATLAKESKSGM